MSRSSTRLLSVLSLASVVGCGSLELDPSDPPVIAVFDPGDSDIPMPNDVLRDAALGRLDLPVDDADLTAADREFRTYLNTLDGWSSAMQATVSFSDAVDAKSIDESTVQIYRWGDTLERVTDVTVALEEQDTKLVISPPREGWEFGARYAVVVRGGAAGVKDLRNRGIAADAAFYYLRLDQALDDPANQRAFPGDTREERMEAAAELEDLRLELAPLFAYFAERAFDPIPREEVASLWSFTVTQNVELAMDKPSQRVPLPFDALIDPETGLVELEPAAWDKPIETDAKTQANELDGFGVSANLFFELTKGVDPATVTAETVRFYELGGTAPRQIPATFRVMAPEGEAPCAASPLPDTCKHIVIVPASDELPLDLGRTYAVVVSKDLRAYDGGEITPMPIGHFMMAQHPLAVSGVSQVGVVDDADAVRLEGVRQEIAPLLDELGRAGLITAWPFTTLTVDDELGEWSNMATRMQTDAQPGNMQTLTVDESIARLFPDDTIRWTVTEVVYPSRLEGIDRVVIGTIPSPYFLGNDRRFRPNREYEMQDMPFTLTIPEGVAAGAEVPLVIFMHGLVMDNRWVPLLAGEFSRRGYAMISIELPYHGDRTTCMERSLIAIPNFFPPTIASMLGYQDELLQIAPCASGSSATCSPEGECLTADGQPDELSMMPVVTMYGASGAAFLDVEDIPHIKDHFLQALADVSSLHRAIFTGDWSAAGITFDLDRVHYTGLSLGAIMGAVWVPYVDGIDRSVLNVVGADMVDLFLGSTFFSPQVDAYFVREGIADGSFEQERLLDVARWLIDSVDPHSVAHHWSDRAIPGLIQQCVGDIIIPNEASEPFVRVSELPITKYDSPLHMNLLIPGDALYGDPMVTEMANFLDAP